MPFAAKGIDWDAAQRAFVERAQKPSYDELGTEFGCAGGSLARLSSENGWPALRARYHESQLTAADNATALLAVVRGDRTLVTGYLSLAVVTLATLQSIVETVQRTEGKAPATMADAVNTCMFAAKNLADALKSAGILAAAKLVERGVTEGRWNPEMLQQINVTVQNLQAQADAIKPASSAPKPTLEVD